MTPEGRSYASELRWIFGEVATALAGVEPQALNERPAKTANSPIAIASHVVGSTRAWI
jgi:hypothetical protein